MIDNMNILGLCFAVLTLVQMSTGEVKLPEKHVHPSMGQVKSPAKHAQTSIGEAKAPEKHEDLLKIIHSLQERVNTLEEDRQRQVAAASTLFLATFSAAEVTVTDTEELIWDNAIINPGGHYSTETGGYTVPYDGYYQFTITKRSDNAQSDFWILVDDFRLTYHDIFTGPDGSDWPSGSFTINLELTAGQVISVETDNSLNITGTDGGGVISSWFTGHMLYVM